MTRYKGSDILFTGADAPQKEGPAMERDTYGFYPRFPDRSIGSLQVRYCNELKDRDYIFTDEWNFLLIVRAFIFLNSLVRIVPREFTWSCLASYRAGRSCVFSYSSDFLPPQAVLNSRPRDFQPVQFNQGHWLVQ